MKKVFTLALLLSCFIAHSQLLTWSSQFPTDASTITITMDATQGNQGLLGFSSDSTVYMHWGVITNLSTGPSNWRYVTTTWATTTAPKATSLGNNKWQIIITNPRSYFSVPAGETILEIALLFRNSNGTLVQRNADGGDLKVPIYAAGGSYIQFTTPATLPENYPISNVPINATIGQPVSVTAAASTASGTLNLYFNGALIAGPLTGTSSISGSAAATSSGMQQFVSELIVDGTSSYDTITYFVAPILAVPASLMPNGIPHEGINYYNCSDSVTLILYAPYKSSAMVIGDFTGSNWLPQSQYLMNRTPDGNYYWITLHGLVSGTQYAFQYLVDNTIYIPDPYAEVVLDGNNDKYIPTTTYPGLKAYPTNTNVSTGKNGLISVLQTCQSQYTWKAANFVPPAKQNLIIEEVLVRDFANSDGAGNFTLLLDSLHYFKSLGINAIELMPVSEFSGDDSWGYNPNFYCALDKAYGTKNMYKTFIDSCHANGISIIMDVVYNQIDDNGDQVPEARLYWNNGAPAANNPWLNQAAPHPYGVFVDLNHTSTATQYWVERSLSYWLTEYHVDGFRLDLAKGFTQSCSNGVNATCPVGSTFVDVEAYDNSRVANLERYYDYVKNNHPGSTMPYMILEFLAGTTPSAEENTYANYGFMLWNSIGTTSKPSQTSWVQNTIGTSTDANLSRAVYNSNDEGFSVPASVDYTGSHDDERMAYATEAYGSAAFVKSISGIGGVLQRQAAAASLLFEMPGPHMFYEFDERGYDITEGNSTSYKPPHWEYLTTDANAVARRACVAAYSKLINLRLAAPTLFSSTNMNYDLYDNNGLFKRFQITDPTAGGLSVTVIANFDITAQTRSVTFQATGNWYNYQSDGTQTGVNGATGSTFSLASAAQNITLQPGEYHVYIYQPSTTYTFMGNGNWDVASNWLAGSMPPATLPSGSIINVASITGGKAILDVQQNVSPGASFNVISGTLSIPLNLNIQQ